jgi:hypothetical protein
MPWMTKSMPVFAHAGKLGGDPEAEFNRKHRVRRPPRRINDNSDSQATLTMTMQFYRREFKFVLETQIISHLGDNLIQCFEAVKPLATVLPGPCHLGGPGMEGGPNFGIHPPQPETGWHGPWHGPQEVVSLFSSNIPVDPFVLHAEFGNFVSHALHDTRTSDK